MEATDGDQITKAAREARVRRALRRKGELLRKDRARSVNLDHHGGDMIIDQNNWIVAGEKFDLSLEQVEAEAGLQAAIARTAAL